MERISGHPPCYQPGGLQPGKRFFHPRAPRRAESIIGPSEETKANKFAANLLMPRDLINLEIDKLSGTKNDKIRAMAKKFEVSEQSMAICPGWTLGK